MPTARSSRICTVQNLLVPRPNQPRGFSYSVRQTNPRRAPPRCPSTLGGGRESGRVDSRTGKLPCARGRSGTW